MNCSYCTYYTFKIRITIYVLCIRLVIILCILFTLAHYPRTLKKKKNCETCKRKATTREQYTTAKTTCIGEYTYIILLLVDATTPLYYMALLLSLSNVVSTVTAAATTINRPNRQRYVTGRFPRPRVSAVPSIEVMYEIRISNPSSIFRVPDNLKFKPNSRYIGHIS